MADGEPIIGCECKHSRRKKSRSLIGWSAAYLLVMASLTAGMVYGRAKTMATYGTPTAQAEWDAWRADAKKMAEEPGVVKRREPKSIEPPALVLMRDHFGVCLSIALVLSTVLFGTFMILVRGAMRGPTRTR